jgi:fructose-1,6-bisphosphatase/inositol monophosphatase family enzyme
MNNSVTSAAELLEPIKRLHAIIRQNVVDATEHAALESLATVVKEEEGDTIYAVDKISEELLLSFFAEEIAKRDPVILIAEGLTGGKVTLPIGARDEDARWRVIVDPIDGTRGLMYQKRSAWILTGVAENRGPDTSLSDIDFAIQTEIPLVKQHLSDSAWAIRGQGVRGERFNRLSGTSVDLIIQPSRARTIMHGYTQVARFFPGARDELASIDEELVLGALGPVQSDKASCFEDQYASTGGQLYELMSGRDRFTADLRPLMESTLRSRGANMGICCHPYDMCTELVAREAGVVVTDTNGNRLDAPLSVEPNIAWAGYANADIHSLMEPLLKAALKKRGLIS